MAADREYKARSIAKAVKIASKELGLSQENLQYDVISHGASGIFGLTGVKKARILVHLPETSPIDNDESTEDRPYFRSQPEGSPDADRRRDEDDLASNDREAVFAVGEQMVRRIVDAISPEASIKVQRDEDEISFNVQGGESGILIGKRGQTLEAIQVLVEKAVRRLNGHRIRVSVDVEGYLKNKEANLVRTAERVAQKVTSKGRPASIGFMNAQDRRIIHLALKNNNAVRTQSVGDGSYRKLMVYPKRRSAKPY